MSIATSWPGIMAPSGGPSVIVTIGPMFTFCSNPGTVTAGVRLNNDGTLDLQDNCGPFSFDQNYLSIGGFAGAADDFEAMCSVLAFTGPNAGNALDTWLPLTSSKQWNWSEPGTFDMGEWRIFVREVAVPANGSNADYDWSVEDGS